MPPLPASDLDHVLIHTQPLWDEMRGQRLFITGGTGFFGCWLLESLAWANAKLDLNASAVVLTRDPAAFAVKAPHLAAHPAFRFHRGDVRHFEFPDGQFPCVIHAATEASAKLNAEDPLTMFDTVVEGTRRTLEFARLHGAKRFLLASSGAVYGRQPPEKARGRPKCFARCMRSSTAWSQRSHAALPSSDPIFRSTLTLRLGTSFVTGSTVPPSRYMATVPRSVRISMQQT
jgi:dTDP-D-glucose 4,6-dehydratase